MSSETIEGFDLADILDEAVALSGGERGEAAEVLSTRRALSLLLTEWNNKGFNTWKTKQLTLGFVPGVQKLSLPAYVDDIFQVNVINPILTGIVGSPISVASASESTMVKIDASRYAQLTTKGTLGQPSQYYLERTDPPSLYIFPTGRVGRTETLNVWYIERPECFDRYSNDLGFPPRWIDAAIQGTALRLSRRRTPLDETLIARLGMEYNGALDAALRSDRHRVSYRVRI